MSGPRPAVIERIVARHFEEAATLWSFRDAAVHETQSTLEDLVELDSRVAAHLDGLRIAREAGWDDARLDVDPADPGEAFVRGLAALETRSADDLAQILAAAQSDRFVARGLVSAFGWASPSHLQGTVKQLLASSGAFRKMIGIAACAVHRVDPGVSLRRALVDESSMLASRAIRGAGELGLADVAAEIQARLGDDEVDVGFWAAWSSVLLGDRANGLGALAEIGHVNARYRARAMQVVLRVLSAAEARDWLSYLRQAGESPRDLIVGVGIVGDPAYVPWLVVQMETPELARLAGEAFATIAGVDFGDQYLKRDRPPEFASGPTDDPDDEDVSTDPDQDLPWPAHEHVRRWWEANSGRFTSGVRYLAGHPVTPGHCRRVLREGRQAFRAAAALELALMEPAAPLFETRAPAWEQRRALESLE